jgi:hypothetical protein
VVDPRGVAGDHPVLLEPVEAPLHRRRREADRLADVGERAAAVRDQEVDDLAIGAVEVHFRRHLHESYVKCAYIG